MLELSMIMLIVPMAMFVIRFVVKRVEINWLTFITGVCGISALLIDDTIDSQTMVIAIMPVILVTMFSALEIMGMATKRGKN